MTTVKELRKMLSKYDDDLKVDLSIKLCEKTGFTLLAIGSPDADYNGVIKTFKKGERVELAYRQKHDKDEAYTNGRWFDTSSTERKAKIIEQIYEDFLKINSNLGENGFTFSQYFDRWYRAERKE